MARKQYLVESSKMKSKIIIPLIALIVCSIVACENRPKEVLSRSEMEDVLYDYHIMQGLIEQLPAEERVEKAQDYINAVYVKHGITEAQFDTSVTYYNRHPKDLFKIYKSLEQRYTAANEEMQLVNGNNDMMAIYATGGDTTNLWNSKRLLLLRSREFANRESFTIHADTTFHRKDHFILTFSPTFIKESTDNGESPYLHVSLSVMYKSGKYIGTVRTLSYNGPQQLTLKTDDDEDIQRITGSFFYKGMKSSRSFCLVDNISLVRMHEKSLEPVTKEKADSTETKASKNLPDTIKKVPTHRYTPEELRQLNKSNEKINIQAAPSVRTPNSIGTRRRKTPANH